MEYSELGKLFSGLRTSVTIADEQGRIVFLNDLALEHYDDRGGEQLIGTSLYDCHNPESGMKIKNMYARYRAGDMTPTRYHQGTENGHGETIVYIPLVTEGRLRGMAELMWNERQDLVFET